MIVSQLGSFIYHINLNIKKRFLFFFEKRKALGGEVKSRINDKDGLRGKNVLSPSITLHLWVIYCCFPVFHSLGIRERTTRILIPEQTNKLLVHFNLPLSRLLGYLLFHRPQNDIKLHICRT